MGNFYGRIKYTRSQGRSFKKADDTYFETKPNTQRNLTKKSYNTEIWHGSSFNGVQCGTVKKRR